MYYSAYSITDMAIASQGGGGWRGSCERKGAVSQRKLCINSPRIVFVCACIFRIANIFTLKFEICICFSFCNYACVRACVSILFMHILSSHFAAVDTLSQWKIVCNWFQKFHFKSCDIFVAPKILWQLAATVFGFLFFWFVWFLNGNSLGKMFPLELTEFN